MRKVTAVSALMLVVAVLALGQNVQEAITASGQAAVKAAIARVAPAVVKIEAAKRVTSWWDQIFQDPFFRRFFDVPPLGGREVTSLGSGFVVEHGGKRYVLTNAHVVEGADSIRVSAQTGKILPAKVVGTDSWLDLAVIAVEDAADLPAAPLGDSDALEIGDWVIAIGNPLGFSHTVTLGIVSALNRDVPRPDGSGYYRRMIQTDAAINPGNSGGPLVNAYGEVVGMNTVIARSTESGVAVEGINFAVPINEIKQVLARMIGEGKVTRAWLGVYIQDLIPGMERQFGVASGQGVLVADVVSGSPAEAAGIRRGDVIVSVAGRKVGSAAALQAEIMYRRVGETVEIGLVRDGRSLTLTVTLGARPDEGTVSPPSPAPGAPKFGLTVHDITPDVARQFGLTQVAGGVIVTAVAPGSPGHVAGVRAGDVIVEVDRRPVKSVEDWNRIVADLPESGVLLTVQREGRTLFLLIQ
ncbi:MAG: Do family serine endopeptidase [Candidatus Acetothermia bacterium]|nr:Do family serine endopeptidase [Candidatus Acetothermia bacterium]